jgi:hypothetical protein
MSISCLGEGPLSVGNIAGWMRRHELGATFTFIATIAKTARVDAAE